MLLCKEQKSVINIDGRDICISDKIANIHYRLFTMPVTADEVLMYFRAENDGDSANALMKTHTNEELSIILETAIKQDLIHYFSKEDAQKIWDSTPE